MKRQILVAAALVLAAQAASAQSMYVRAPAQYLGYGYGNSNWVTFSGMWDTKFGAGNITKGGAISSLTGYTSLLLDANQPGTATYNLSASEISVIGTFLAGGGRIYGFGENSAWSSWNTDLLGLFGATGGFNTAADNGTPNVANNLTAGVNSIYAPSPGQISNFNGGVSLFSNDIVGLFNNNSIVVLDINICDNGRITQADNARFCQNIVDFTAGGPVLATPEPSSVILLATGLVGIVGVVRRRRNVAS